MNKSSLGPWSSAGEGLSRSATNTLPMPTSSMRRAGALLDVARFSLPRPVAGSNFRNWNAIVPAFVGLGAAALEAVFQLPPPQHRLAAEIVTRSLVDYTITFAWLAAPVKQEERDERIARLRIGEFNEWLKVHNRYAETLPKYDVYAERIKSGAMPTGLIEPSGLDHIEEAKQAAGAKGMPSLLDCAIQADEVWIGELDTVASQPFAHIYGIVFSGFSFKTHASLTAVRSMVVDQPPNMVIGVPEPIGSEPMRVYGLACSVFTDMLLCASRRVGWPDEQAVRAATVQGLPGAQP